METKELPILDIHEMSEEQYKREKEAGRIDEDAIYVTPDEGHEHSISEIKDFPDYAAADDGQFLRVVDGKPAWVTVRRAEEYAF